MWHLVICESIKTYFLKRSDIFAGKISWKVHFQIARLFKGRLNLKTVQCFLFICSILSSFTSLLKENRFEQKLRHHEQHGNAVAHPAATEPKRSRVLEQWFRWGIPTSGPTNYKEPSEHVPEFPTHHSKPRWE